MKRDYEREQKVSNIMYGILFTLQGILLIGWIAYLTLAIMKL